MPRQAASSTLLVSCVLLANASLSLGETALQTRGTGESRNTQSQVRSTTDAQLEERLARDWGLQTDEWTRYRRLMQGPLGIYSPNLDPLTALGIESSSEEERQHFAQMQVQVEGRRVEKMLAYQRAYDEAWKRLHPTLQPLNRAITAPRGGSDTEVATGGTGRLAVFVKDNCIACEQRVKQLLATRRAFDLYMVGSRQQDALIRQWAARVGIDPTKVRSRVITLNHDAGRWLSIGGQGELPAVVTDVNGQWQRE
jgi:integrating conjugative element protein (TIGR03759 family)